MVSMRHGGRAAFLTALPSRILSAAGGAVSRFPFTVLCLVVAALLSNAWIAGYGELSGSQQRHILAALSVAVLWSVGMSSTLAAAGRPRAVSHAASAATGVAAGGIAWLHEPFEGASSVLQLASLLFLFVMPFIRRSEPVGLWSFVLRSFAAFGLAFVAVLAFVSGMVLLVELFRLLFGIGPGWETYAHVYATALLLVGPMATLGLFPEAGTSPPSARLEGLARNFLSFVAVPLLIAALIVLHLYAVRVVVTGDLAVRDMVWIVPVLLLDLAFVRFLSVPFDGARAPRAVRAVRRFWPMALPVPLVLFTLAISAESARGWSLGMYYAALFCVVCAMLGVMQFMPAMRGDPRWFLGLPAVALAASLFGPWGAAAVTSQMPVRQPAAPVPSFSDYNAPAAPALPVGGFDLVLADVALGREAGNASLDFSARFEDGDLVLRRSGGAPVRFAMTPVMEAIAARPGAPQRGTLAAASGQTLFYDVKFLRLVDGQPQIGRMTILLRAADWR
ncbi:DUF4153 domain-containing protein [Aureimonas sp. OT7]|uniref:DUF4153 domain-containing protein n=1 Tax=Aureimonas TaxID=414371 RepID=UPI0017852565|nr:MULTISPECIES: DUF4153 domain-containing protein [Aureimonas]QOG05035.1 DUF4153 domain-containing protein [Aureimonas sp. OT7]